MSKKIRTSNQIFVEAGIYNLCMFLDAKSILVSLKKIDTSIHRRLEKYENLWNEWSSKKNFFNKKKIDYYLEALEQRIEDYTSYAEEINQRIDEIVQLTTNCFEIPHYPDIISDLNNIPNLAYMPRD